MDMNGPPRSPRMDEPRGGSPGRFDGPPPHEHGGYPDERDEM